MRTERDSLKETIEELHCVQAQEGQLASGGRLLLLPPSLPTNSVWLLSHPLVPPFFSGLLPLGGSGGSDSLAAEITTPEIR